MEKYSTNNKKINTTVDEKRKTEELKNY